jgi:coniferyl-aldehyde dehydrogenase
MDQSLKSPTLEDTFHATFDASRADPAPACDMWIDRLRRLRALVSDNETRFEQARQSILPRHALAP